MHGIGGIVGALLTGVFAYGPLSATDAAPAARRAVSPAENPGEGGLRRP